MTSEAAIEPTPAPDYIEALTAWRAWNVVRYNADYRLASVFAPMVWPTGEPLAAACLRQPRLLDLLRPAESHEAPGSGCECGIYGTSLPAVGDYLLALVGRAGAGRVVGEVALWGEVVECERGFRASLAYPHRLYVPTGCTHRDGWEVARALADYGVPVELVPGRGSEAMRELERRLAA